MPLNSDEETRVVRYLLGLATPDERSTLERRLFDDDEWAEEVQALESELVRDYVRNRLQADDRKHFEEHYLSNPGLRNKIEETRQIIDAMQPKLSTRLGRLVGLPNPAGVLGLSAAAAALCVAAWLGAEYTGMKREVSRLQHTVAPAEPKSTKMATFLLSSGTLRGGGSSPGRLTIPADIVEVQFELDYPKASPAEQYRATLRTIGGAQLSSTRATATGRGTVTALLNAGILATEDYILRLETLEPGGYDEVESYSFGVTR